MIGARFDVDTAGEACRLAFYGRLVGSLGQGEQQDLKKLQVYKVRRACNLRDSRTCTRLFHCSCYR